MAAAVASGVWQTERPPLEAWISGVRTLRFCPIGSARATVIHLHGGAFRNGAPEMIGPYAIRLADRCKVDVILPAYRLAPENPFPAGLLDSLAVATALGKDADHPVILSGDSAGGGLATSLAKLCLSLAIPIRALVLHSPWLDLTFGSETYQTNAETDTLFSLQSAVQAALLYLQGLSAEQPLVSPVLGSVTGFPPTFISVGTGEILAGEGYRLHGALTKAGVSCKLVSIDGMEHVAVTRDLGANGALETFAAAAAFIDNILQ